MQPSTAGVPSTVNEAAIVIDSSLGPVYIRGTAGHISCVSFTDKRTPAGEAPPLLYTCAQQLEEYFAGTRKIFDLPLAQPGTPFQQCVWDELTRIPFGETITYLALAHRIGNVKAIRAVGAANGRNDIAVIVPCHRVIGSNGALTGYAGGLWRKQRLLELEKGGLLF
ncbi:methylated-DNA--[protein]-cysteine S-methyltransferase [Chitinophaga lutea]